MRLIAWYGDDFTGSTDVLDALAPHMRVVLFLRRPEAEFLERFRDYEAIGLAGVSRSQTPEWMDAHLTPDLEWLATLKSLVCHYKVCSTFDSAPHVGSIGRAMEIGKKVFDVWFVPLIVGAPPLGRYTFFGHLFARGGSAVYRIDRHPTMAHHPVTPMGEADLRTHLAAQTTMRVGLMDGVRMKTTGDPEAAYRDAADGFDAVLIDVFDAQTQQEAGSLVWGTHRQPFVVGSSGVEYALIEHWTSTDALPGTGGSEPAPPVDRIAVASGSCSPVTEGQIRHAESAGFVLAKLDPAGWSMDDAVLAGVEALKQGRSIVFYSAGPGAERVDGIDRQDLAVRTGRLLRRVLDETGVKRAVVAGGDTSSHAGAQLGIDAVTFLAPVAPGAPLCKAWGAAGGVDLEIVFKGGQIGGPDFFAAVRNGGKL
ncbi:MAG: four-carbon acid sugar kinase family protein [Bryobacteraceae bacterium]